MVGTIRVGGVVSYSDRMRGGGVIQCVNYGKIICNATQTELGPNGDFSVCGGVAASGKVTESANFGVISAKECTLVGGVVGKSDVVINSFNSGIYLQIKLC